MPHVIKKLSRYNKSAVKQYAHQLNTRQQIDSGTHKLSFVPFRVKGNLGLCQILFGDCK